MLLRCSIENWMSFKDVASFSMIASRERQHGETLTYIPKYKIKVLPLAALYGGNASGKTNFVKAIGFARVLIVRGTRPDVLISVEPFKLDVHKLDEPTRFEFELLVNETIYEFSFSATRKHIVEERLVEISVASEKVLYERKRGQGILFHSSLKENQALSFVAKGTRENQLFLTNSVFQNITLFKPIYDWFMRDLEIITPDSKFEPFELFFNKELPLYGTINTRLAQLDTGITDLGGEDIPFDSLPLSEQARRQIQEELPEGWAARLILDSNERVIITRKSGEIFAKKLVAYHKRSDGSQVKFDMKHESDGTLRVIDLLPAFNDISNQNSKKVYIIDELDRSLHTLMTRQLLEMYLATCSPENRSQLLFTTHDVSLMDQHLIRRDEMWIAEREREASRLFSFSDFKDVRYDKDIRKSYLQGRLGGVPRISAAPKRG